ncbi:MAG: anti-sigma factor [Kurthia sp.]|nr:anti-sigma factor [Candidatus Kurthia equi]
MNACKKEIVTYMHEYLDGDITPNHEHEMQQHLHECTDCQQHMNELQHVVHMLKTLPAVQVPKGFVEGVMDKLPRTRINAGRGSWLRRHPFLIAAAVFVLLMSASLLSGYNGNKEFSVTNQPGLIVEGNTVTVPKAATVKGDVIVENGDLIIEGTVDGDVTVVNGQYMASTANVTGQIEEVDETFEWIWYTIKDKAKKIFSFN